MSWHEFVFSDNLKHRLARHFVFWLAWWLYFFTANLFLPVYFPGNRQRVYLSLHTGDFIRLTLLLSVQVLICYAAIYYLLPRYLMKAKYFLFFVGAILSVFAAVLVCRFIYVTLMPFIEPVISNTGVARINKTAYWTSISDGGINSIKIIAAALAIKLGKHRWFKQKEKERFEKDKIEAELQLLKAQIHPGFLFNTLNNIYSFSLAASPKAPEMLLKLSEILSYMLYECDEKEVSLEKEIKMLKDYMALEKTRYGDRLEMNLQVKGHAENKKIAPLLLLRFIENSFLQCGSNMTEQPWINLEMQIENDSFFMKLMNGKPAGNVGMANDEENNISHAQKRLRLLYPSRHELKIMEEPEIVMVYLQIKLSQGPMQKHETMPILPEVKESVRSFI